MKILRKYRFGSKGAASTKINALGEEHSHLIVQLGNPLSSEAIDSSKVVYSNDWLVDVLWDGEADASWENGLVWTSSPKHLMGGGAVRAEYMNTCRTLHPELFPVPVLEEEVEEQVQLP